MSEQDPKNDFPTRRARARETLRRMKLIASGALIGTGLLAAAVFFFSPGDWYEVQNRWKLYRSGSRPIFYEVRKGEEPYRGMERNLCRRSVSKTVQRSSEAPIKSDERCHCVFLVHGGADSILTWRRWFLMDAREIPEKTHFVALDLPRSPRTVSQVASDFLSYLEKDLGDAVCDTRVVVGNSLGGWIALQMAKQSSERPPGEDRPLVDGVVSLAGTGLKSIPFDETFLKAFRESPTIEGLKEFQARAYDQPRSYPESFWKAALERAKSGKGESVQTPPEDVLDGKLHKMDVPILYLWGEADRIVPRAMGEALVKEAPRVTFKTLPKCGHLPQKECPEETLNEVSVFLRAR